MSTAFEMTIHDILAHEKMNARKPSYASSRPVSFVTARSASDEDDGFTDGISESDYDTDDDCAMPATIAQAVPAVPVKSAQRISRFLDIQTLEIKKADAEQTPVISAAPPHDVYLSSEEDASSSADDFSDCGSQSDSDMSQGSPLGCSLHELTARTITVVFKGKPSMVDLSAQALGQLPPRSTARPGAANGGLRRIPTDSALPRQSSYTTIKADSKPARYSMYNAGDMDARRTSHHQFLETDPFPHHPTKRDSLQGLPAEFTRRPGSLRSRSKSTGRESMRSSSPSTRSIRSVSSLAQMAEERPSSRVEHHDAPVEYAAPAKSHTAPTPSPLNPQTKRRSTYEAPSVFSDAQVPRATPQHGGPMSRLRAGLLGRRKA